MVATMGFKPTAFDPKARKKEEMLLSKVDWQEDPCKLTAKTDLLVIFTEWNECRTLDLKRISSAMREPKLADFSNLYSAAKAYESGFNYRCTYLIGGHAWWALPGL